MTALSAAVARAVVDAYDFGRFTTVVDVGGGRGALLAAILARHPHLHGVLVDQPDVVGAPDDLLLRSGADSAAPGWAETSSLPSPTTATPTCSKPSSTTGPTPSR